MRSLIVNFLLSVPMKKNENRSIFDELITKILLAYFLDNLRV